MNIISHSLAMQQLLDHSSELAKLTRPILILGERGTGKELLAHRLHYLSPRWDKAFIRVNCASFSEGLLDSELFGHEQGAFTDAKRIRRGLFERADGGTLFLDELGTLSPRVQEKLLRVLEYGELERLGSEQSLKVDVRVVAATNEDLVQACEQGRFRWDLLDRLCFDLLQLPPLRQRPDDILPLAEHFAVKMSQELGWQLFPGFAAQAEQQLLNWPWPGNVRELKNTVERSLAQSPKDQALSQIRHNPLAKLRSEPPHSGTSDWAFCGRLPLKQAIEQLEQLRLTQALELHPNQQQAADALGLNYHQLRALMRKHQAK